jgi:hypothetical protein
VRKDVVIFPLDHLGRNIRPHDQFQGNIGVARGDFTHRVHRVAGAETLSLDVEHLDRPPQMRKGQATHCQTMRKGTLGLSKGMLSARYDQQPRDGRGEQDIVRGQHVSDVGRIE